jgi:hypothetical protein
MAVNKHFHTNGIGAIASEQSLYADLVAESIRHKGHDVYYLDRTLVAEDNVLGEDSLSKFNNQAPIEMYMEDSDLGYGGQRELLTQFGLQNLSEATFVVSKTKFQDKTKQIQIETATDSTSSGAIQLEAGTVTDGTISYILNETDATDADRPFEGDAIYHPQLGKLFEINFVDHDDPFHQLDNNPVYKMRCRLFDYSSEQLGTGITEIDAISDDLSTASSEFQFTLERSSILGDPISLDFSELDLSTTVTLDSTFVSFDPLSFGESLILEDGSYIISEEFVLGDGVTDKTAQNDLFDNLDDTVLDFSESNPFGDVGSVA